VRRRAAIRLGELCDDGVVRSQCLLLACHSLPVIISTASYTTTAFRLPLPVPHIRSTMFKDVDTSPSNKLNMSGARLNLNGSNPPRSNSAADRDRPEMARKSSSPLMPPFMVSAPGKVIVYGEHAVVHGKVFALYMVLYLLATDILRLLSPPRSPSDRTFSSHSSPKRNEPSTSPFRI
jgi:hypothetical protein